MAKILLILEILLLASIPCFAQTVDTAWVKRYNGPGSARDAVFAIAIGSSGNMYVTGMSRGSIETYEDYATIKYYPNGDTAWVRRYDGSIQSYDWAWAIAVDDSENVYVTGESRGIGSSDDFLTIKYYPNGDTGWIRRYNGPGNDNDEARAIAIDGFGNIYVSGYSTGSGTGYDFATIKYYPNGDTAWVRRYNESGNFPDYVEAMTVDCSGSIYVTGGSYNSVNDWGYVTIKYYPNGDTAWVRRYDGSVKGTDFAFDIAVDCSSNVYVTGYSWDSKTLDDYATIKYYPNGDTAWVRKFSSAGWDEAHAIAIDDSGNVYVTGYSSGFGTYLDYATIKYYSNGDTAWVRRYNGPGNNEDAAHDIAVDKSGNVYITGYSWDSTTLDDYATIKYYPNGDIAWITRYNGPANSGDGATALMVDDSSNIYVTGSTFGIGTGPDYTTIKYIQTPGEVKDETGNREKPSEFILSQNYPNPFNLNTKIEFTLPHPGFASLNIYDLLGRKVRTLVSENLSPGYKSVLWDGKDNSGKQVASGIYFYRLQVGDFSGVKKLVLLK